MRPDLIHPHNKPLPLEHVSIRESWRHLLVFQGVLGALMVPLVLDPPRGKKNPNYNFILLGPCLSFFFSPLPSTVPSTSSFRGPPESCHSEEIQETGKAAPALSLPRRLATIPGSAGEVLPQA